MTAYVAVVREHPIDGWGVVSHLLDSDGLLVWDHICSDSRFAKSDAEAEIARLGGTLERFVDQTAAGRPWLPLALAGTFGCPICGGLVWQPTLHARACPPQEPFLSVKGESCLVTGSKHLTDCNCRPHASGELGASGRTSKSDASGR